MIEGYDATLVCLELAGGDACYWDGIGLLEHDGRTFIGTGTLGSVSVGAASAETQVNDVVFVLSGVDAEEAGLADVTVKGAVALVWKAVLRESDMAVLAAVQICEAVCDQITLSLGEGGETVIKVTAIGGFYWLEQPSAAVWDVEAQRQMLTAAGEDPDSDTGFDRMHTLRAKEIAWLPE